MITRFHEFHCLFHKGISAVSGQPEYDMGTICIDLGSIVAFNPFTKKGYTVVRMTDANSYVIDYPYENLKQLLQRQFVTTDN